jgi:uncharacterized protein YggE
MVSLERFAPDAIRILVILLTGIMAGARPVAAQVTGGMNHAAHMTGSPTERTIRVSGAGLMEAPPDLAYVQFSIVSNDDAPDRARTLNAEASRETMNAVRALGIDETDIRMRTLQLQPKQEWNPDKRRWESQGFEATRSVEVTVRDLEMLPQLVADVVERGANRIESVRYALDDRKELEREALRQAVADARAKAGAMAGVVDANVGMVISIQEQGVSMPQPVVRSFEAMTAKDAAGAAEPEAFAGGLIEVRASVTVVFELE